MVENDESVNVPKCSLFHWKYNNYEKVVKSSNPWTLQNVSISLGMTLAPDPQTGFLLIWGWVCNGWSPLTIWKIQGVKIRWTLNGYEPSIFACQNASHEWTRRLNRLWLPVACWLWLAGWLADLGGFGTVKTRPGWIWPKSDGFVMILWKKS